MNKFHLPCVHGCSLNDSLVDNETLVRELIFTYKCINNCGNCHLLNVSYRTMRAELAVHIVEESINYAETHSYTKLVLHLIGGEVLDDFDALKKFYNKISDFKSMLHIYFIVDTCGRNLTDECKKWLSNNEDILLRLRWNDFTKSEVWDKDSDFWSRKTYTILWKINKKDFSKILSNADILFGINKPIVPEYSYLGRLDINDYMEYCRQLNYLARYNALNYIIPSNLKNEHIYDCNANKQIETIDFDGKKYFCKYMSPMYNLKRVYTKVYEPLNVPDTCRKCSAKDVCELCPAARVLKNNTQCELLRRQYRVCVIKSKNT